MTITCELGATAANALATESCLRSPPSTTITSSRYAGGFAASSEGSATTTSSKGYPVRNVSTVRLRMGTPASNSNCLGCAPPNREPRPPAAMIAETCTNSILVPLSGQQPRRFPAARVLLHPLRRHVHHARQPRRVHLARREHHEQPARRCGLPPRARGIGSRGADRTRRHSTRGSTPSRQQGPVR